MQVRAALWNSASLDPGLGMLKGGLKSFSFKLSPFSCTKHELGTVGDVQPCFQQEFSLIKDCRARPYSQYSVQWVFENFEGANPLTVCEELPLLWGILVCVCCSRTIYCIPSCVRVLKYFYFLITLNWKLIYKFRPWSWNGSVWVDNTYFPTKKSWHWWEKSYSSNLVFVVYYLSCWLNLCDY